MADVSRITAANTTNIENAFTNDYAQKFLKNKSYSNFHGFYSFSGVYTGNNGWITKEIKIPRDSISQHYLTGIIIHYYRIHMEIGTTRDTKEIDENHHRFTVT